MEQLFPWLAAHWHEVVEVAGALWLIVSVYVALTPSKADDAWLAQIAQRISFLGPRNAPGFSLPGVKPKPPEEPEEPPK